MPEPSICTHVSRSYLLPGAFVLLSGVTLGGCLCSSSGVNQGDINLVPLEEEWRMGAALEQQLATELTFAEDAAALAYVNQLGQRLVAETEMAEMPWTFHIVADSAINAFATPGGHVYVNTGLIHAAGNVAELAGVMAHEISHGVGRHTTERLTTLYGLDVVGSLILGDSPGILQQIAAQIIGSGAVAKFSRDDEREADRLGLQYMYAAGFNPEGMAAMFETLLESRQQRPNMLEQFFSSHPLTEERIETVRQEAEMLETRDSLTTDDPEFRQIQERLRLLHGQPSW
jgi:beta-barrel assembly-enhancing protease